MYFMSGKIYAPTTSTELTGDPNQPGNKYGDISSTTLTGDKRGLDIAVKEMPAVTGTFTPSGLTIGGKITVVTLNATTWTALPATALTSRNGLAFQNPNAEEVKINFSSGIAGYVGWAVNATGEFFIDVSDSITVYAKSASGTPTLTVMEVA